jgi:hypothetical protein
MQLAQMKAEFETIAKQNNELQMKAQRNGWKGRNMNDGKQSLMQRLRSWWQGLVAIPVSIYQSLKQRLHK